MEGIVLRDRKLYKGSTPVKPVNSPWRSTEGIWNAFLCSNTVILYDLCLSHDTLPWFSEHSNMLTVINSCPYLQPNLFRSEIVVYLLPYRVHLSAANDFLRSACIKMLDLNWFLLLLRGICKILGLMQQLPKAEFLCFNVWFLTGIVQCWLCFVLLLWDFWVTCAVFFRGMLLTL